jgi:hypothetical protein
MNAVPPMPMGGGNQPQMPGMMSGGMPGGMPGGPPPLNQMGGGPTSPMNIEQMLQPQGALQPEQASGAPMNGMGGSSGPGQSMPMIMLEIMKQLGLLGG